MASQTLFAFLIALWSDAKFLDQSDCSRSEGGGGTLVDDDQNGTVLGESTEAPEGKTLPRTGTDGIWLLAPALFAFAQLRANRPDLKKSAKKRLKKAKSE